MHRTRFFAYIGALIVAALLVAGCATTAPSQQPPTTAVQKQGVQQRIEAARAALQHGSATDALKQLAALPSSLPSDLEQQVLELTARAQLANGDRVAAARALIKRAALLPAAEQTSDQQQAVVILAGMGNASLTSLYKSLADNDPLKPWVQTALSQPGAATQQVLPQPRQPVGTLLGSAAPEGYAMPDKVALLVPATGRLAAAGAAVRDGFFTGYFNAPVVQEKRPAIHVYDTHSTVAGAMAAYQDAVTNGAALVVGPLDRQAVSAIFAQSTLPVPVLALNHPEGTAPTPAGSYEFGLMPEAEGAQLAARMISQGLQAAIVFRGDSPNTQRTFTAFKSEFKTLGGQVANDIVLQRGAVDFESQVQAALAGSGSQTGIVALLRPVQARLLLPQLRLERSTLPVFSTSMVYSGDENPAANRDLDGVEFSDEPWLYDAQSGLPDHAALAAELTTASGPAARLFAFGMDAYALMPYLGWLRANPGSYLPGATGELTVDMFGHVQRTPIWVQFHGGVARPMAADLEAQPAAAATTSSGS